MGVLSTTTFPTILQFAEWVIWAEGKMKSYLQCGDTLPTDVGGILEDVADDLIIRKYRYEKEVGFGTAPELLGTSLPELTPENKEDLNSLKGQSVDDTDPPAFNFTLDTLKGGFED